MADLLSVEKQNVRISSPLCNCGFMWSERVVYLHCCEYTPLMVRGRTLSDEIRHLAMCLGLNVGQL